MSKLYFVPKNFYKSIIAKKYIPKVPSEINYRKVEIDEVQYSSIFDIIVNPFIPDGVVVIADKPKYPGHVPYIEVFDFRKKYKRFPRKMKKALKKGYKNVST